jgi:hyperosmotically inducible periplasmic protein
MEDKVDASGIASKLVLAAALTVLALAGCDRGAADKSSAAKSDSAVTGSASTSSGASGPSSSSASTGSAIDDSIITTKVKTALLADTDIKGSDINVETHQGEVLLSGFVGSKTQVDKAVKIASAVQGVKKVTDKTSVKQ